MEFRLTKTDSEIIRLMREASTKMDWRNSRVPVVIIEAIGNFFDRPLETLESRNIVRPTNPRRKAFEVTSQAMGASSESLSGDEPREFPDVLDAIVAEFWDTRSMTTVEKIEDIIRVAYEKMAGSTPDKSPSSGGTSRSKGGAPRPVRSSAVTSYGGKDLSVREALVVYYGYRASLLLLEKDPDNYNRGRPPSDFLYSLADYLASGLAFRKMQEKRFLTGAHSRDSDFALAGIPTALFEFCCRFLVENEVHEEISDEALGALVRNWLSKKVVSKKQVQSLTKKHPVSRGQLTRVIDIPRPARPEPTPTPPPTQGDLPLPATGEPEEPTGPTIPPGRVDGLPRAGATPADAVAAFEVKAGSTPPANDGMPLAEEGDTPPYPEIPEDAPAWLTTVIEQLKAEIAELRQAVEELREQLARKPELVVELEPEPEPEVEDDEDKDTDDSGDGQSEDPLWTGLSKLKIWPRDFRDDDRPARTIRIDVMTARLLETADRAVELNHGNGIPTPALDDLILLFVPPDASRRDPVKFINGRRASLRKKELLSSEGTKRGIPGSGVWRASRTGPFEIFQHHTTKDAHMALLPPSREELVQLLLKHGVPVNA